MNDRSQMYVGQQQVAGSVNKVLRNTYALLAMTLAFSAVTATISTMMNLPYPGFFHHFDPLCWFAVWYS